MWIGERVSNPSYGSAKWWMGNGMKTGHGTRKAADSWRGQWFRQTVRNHVFGRAMNKTNGAGVNHLLAQPMIPRIKVLHAWR